MEPPKNSAINSLCQLVFLGDSITCLFDATIFSEEYSKYYALNLGVCAHQTTHVIERLENGLLDNLTPNIIVVLIGVNNYGAPPEYAFSGVQQIITKIHSKLPETKILLLGIFPFGQFPNTPPREHVTNVNNLIKHLSSENVVYFDFGKDFLNDDGTIDAEIMPDYLHLSRKGYSIFANAIRDKIKHLMNV